MKRNFDLSNGKRGAALAVRITPRASRNQLVEVQGDGSVKVHLVSDTTDDSMNTELLRFLSDVLGTPIGRLDIVAGRSGRDKIVSILDMDVDTVNQRLVAHMD